METIKRLGQWEKRVGEMLLADIGSIRLKSCATFIIKKTVTEIQSEAEGGGGGGEGGGALNSTAANPTQGRFLH